MWRLRQTGRYSYPNIGALFNRDHTTVLYSVGEYEARLADDGQLPLGMPGGH